ncbi:glycosyltransferase family 39 protein [Candidatus Woesearchaeota archaeon]|nr:glycosyltransferase family 39 protein [Candidatus Woesearchaeota archaeon]
MLQLLSHFVYLAFVALGVFAVGNALRGLIYKPESRLEAFLAGSGMGFVALSAALFFLGILKLFVAPVFLTLHLILLAFLVAQAKQLVNLLIPDLSWLKGSSLFVRFAFLVFAVIAVLNFTVASSPPVSADALLYHLAIPKIYLSEGGIVHIPWLQVISEMPMSIDLLYMYGMSLLDGKLSQLIGAYMSFLSSLVVFLLARRLTLSNQAGIVAAALFLTLPIISVFNVRSYVDIPIAFFALLAISFFLDWIERLELRYAVLVGIFLGMTLAGKTISLVVLAAILACVAVLLFRFPFVSKKKILMQLLVAGAICAAIFLPWIVKSYVHTGDPLHPYLYSHFGGRYWNDDLDRIVLEETYRAKGIGFSPFSLVRFPFEITVNPGRFADTAGITPVFLGFLPLLFLITIKRRAGALLLLALLLVLLYFLLAQYTRYMVPLWGIMSVVTAYIAHNMKGERLVQAGLYLFIMLALAANGIFWMGANADSLPVAIGLESESDYLKANVPTYAATQHLSGIDKDAVVCWYGSGRGYWSSNPYVWCNPFLQAYVNFFNISVPSDLAGRLASLNVSYVLFENEMREPILYGDRLHLRWLYSQRTVDFHMRSNELLFAYLGNHSQKVYEDKSVELYKITPVAVS